MTHPAPAGKPLVSVVVPTLNEGDNIDRLLTHLFAERALEGRLEVVVADDHSTDATPEVVRRWAQTHPVRLVQRDGPPDLAASVVAGARAAQGRWVAVMDADGSHPAAMIPRLIEPLEAARAEISIGSRHVEGGGVRGWPWWRRLVSRTASLLAWPFTEVRDPMSGLFATDRERLAALPERRAGYKILLELLVRNTPQARVEEVPFEFTDRDAGESKMGLATQWLFVQRLAALGGARLELGNASKFGLVGLSGLAVDLAAFQLLFALGSGLAGAHMGSFLAATVSNFALNYRWTFAKTFMPGEPVHRRYLRFLAVALMGLMIRGAVLAALVHGLGMDPVWAIVPAVIVTAGVNYLGSIFYVFPARDHEAPARVRWHLGALGLIAYVFALRALYLGQAELIFDEMYYWTWHLHPALSYLDHPPLVAWIIAAGAWIAGDNPLGVRLGNLVLAPLAAWFVYLYGRDAIGKSAGLFAALLMFTIPAYWAGGFLMTPDAPLNAAWAAALFFFHKTLVRGERRAFLGLGAAMGLGLLAKYTIVLLAPAAALFMLFDARARGWFFRPEPYLAALLATLIFLPVLIWNWQNDWASFAFQGARRLSSGLQFSSHWIVIFLLVMLAPLAGFVALYVIGPVRRLLAPEARSRRFMLFMTLVPVAIFAILGIFSRVKFHWTIPIWIGFLPLIGATMAPWLDAGRFRWLERLRRLWPPVLMAKVIVFGLLLHYFVLGLPGIPRQDYGLGYLGWAEMAEEVHALEQEVEARTGKRPLIAAMTKWAVAAALSFHDVDGRRDNITSRHLVGMRGSQWEYWFDPDIDPDRPVILVNYQSKLIDEEWLELVIRNLGPLQTRTVYRDGRPIRTLYYRIGDGFSPEHVRRPEHGQG